MELSKYQKALRAMTNRNSNLDRVIYDPSIVELDTMPVENPPMDNVMPSFEGLEDPKVLEDYQQIELAEGGVVEREGFYKAGLVRRGENKGKYSIPKFYFPETGEVKTVYFDSLEEANQAIENKKNKFKEFREKNKNTKAILNDPDKKMEFIKYANSPNVSGKDIAKKFGISQAEFYTAGLRDLIKKDLQFQQASKIRSNTVKNMVLLHNNETTKKFLRKGEIVPNEILKKMGINPFSAANATVRLAQAYAGKDFGHDELKKIQKNKEASDKLFKIMEKSPFGNPYNSYLYTASLEAIDDQLGKKSGTFASLKSQARQILAKNKIKGFDINEIAGVTGTAKSGAGEFAQFIDIMESNLNQKEMASFQAAFSRARSKIKTDPENFTTYAKKINDLALDFENRYGATLPKIRKAADVDKYYSPERLEQLKKQGLDIKEASKKLKYTIEMPKGAVTIEEFVKNKEIQNKVLDTLNLQERSVLTGFGNKVAMGFDPTDIINALPEREAQILRGVGSKIGNIAKLGARGLAEITTGLGPLGIGITAAVTAPFALYDISQGDRASEVLQNTASDLTFGLTPRADERIIKEIGGESAVRGYEIQQKIDEFKTARKNLKNLNEQLNDPSSTLLSEDQDSILASIERNENILKQRAADIQPLIKDGKIVSPDYDSYLRSADKRKLEKKFTKEKRLEESNIYGGIEGETQTDFTNPKLERLEKLQKSLKKTYEENQPKPVEDIMTQYLSYGGRVGLKKGTKPPKPTIPINPLTDPRPENPDRRDFLKGAGALGLAVAAFGTGALKLAKTLKSKTALEILAKPATGQPEWFAPLVDKIITKGVYTKNLDKVDTYTFKEGDQTLKLIKTEPETFPNGYTYGGDIRIEADAGGAFDQPFSMTYFPNIKYVTEGQKVSRPGFQVIESRPGYTRVGPDDFDLEDIEYVHSTGGKDVDLLELPKGETGILSDMEGLEKIATGKIKNPILQKKRQEVSEKLMKNPTEDRVIEYYDDY